jgi:site-specific DNA-methyltransferase (adenine-specific)
MKNMILIQGDCITEMQKLIEEEVKVDLVLTDPPYGTTSCNWDSIIPLNDMWKCLEDLIKPKGNILLFSSGMFTHKLALSNERLYRYELIWKKSKCGSPFTAKYMPLKKHENILVFGESASYYNPQLTKGEPYKRNFTEYKKNDLKYGVKGCKTDNKGTRHPISVLDYPQKWRRQDQLHPTQKPVELLEFLVKSYSKQGGLVLDFTMGSGSTGVACQNTNRRFIGIELDETYYNISVERLKENNKQKKLI